MFNCWYPGIPANHPRFKRMIQPTTTDPLSNEVLLGRGKMTKLPLKIIQIKNTHTQDYVQRIWKTPWMNFSDFLTGLILPISSTKLVIFGIFSIDSSSYSGSNHFQSEPHTTLPEVLPLHLLEKTNAPQRLGSKVEILSFSLFSPTWFVQ